MTLPPLLPALMSKLETLPALKSVLACSGLAHAQSRDHDQTVSPKALVYLSSLEADNTTPLLQAYQMRLSWTFGVLLATRLQSRFGQDQMNTLESLQLGIIETLSGHQLHNDLTPLQFLKSQHQNIPLPEDAPNNAIVGRWQTTLHFHTTSHTNVINN
jgi:hypothetical protein